MKKAIITLSVIMLTVMSAFAQSGDETTRYYTPKGTQGWFVDLAGTYSLFASTGSQYRKINTYYGGLNQTNARNLFGLSAKLGRRVGTSAAVRVGYDWHPSYNADSYFSFKSLHVDFMESPLDFLMGYNPDRFYTMWLYGGVGLLACDKFPNGKTWGGNYRFLIHWNSALELGAHAGIMNNFRISNRLDFHIDLQTVITSWHYDSDTRDYWTEWHRAHYELTAMAGFMYYIGGRRFDVAEKAEIVETDCSAQERRIEELVEELERCRANNNVTIDNQGNVVQPSDTIVKFVEGESITYPFSIFFNKGSYDLRDGRDRVNLEEFAKVAKANGYKVTLRGTCDSATASSAFNQTLAENRCNKIKQELVKLGVPENNIIINAVGGVKELNPTEYDRRVLIQLSK